MTIMELGALGEFISGASHHRPDIDPHVEVLPPALQPGRP